MRSRHHKTKLHTTLVSDFHHWPQGWTAEILLDLQILNAEQENRAQLPNKKTKNNLRKDKMALDLT
jgi:hypothetical protein